MKVEFVKETKENGDVFYYTTIDGMYANDSMRYGDDNKISAREVYNTIIVNKGVLKPKKEIIESIEIEVK
jgi:hypothetical protein